MITRRRAPAGPAPRLLDCRKVGHRMSSLSFRPLEGGQRGSVAAHEGLKPNVGDYLALTADDGLGAALYVCETVDHCWNVDPPNMWMAGVRFVPGTEARKLDLPEMTR